MKFYLIFFLFLFKLNSLSAEIIKLDCNPKKISSNNEINWEFFKVEIDTDRKTINYNEKRPGKTKVFNLIVSSIKENYIYFVNAADKDTKLFDYNNFYNLASNDP